MFQTKDTHHSGGVEVEYDQVRHEDDGDDPLTDTRLEAFKNEIRQRVRELIGGETSSVVTQFTIDKLSSAVAEYIERAREERRLSPQELPRVGLYDHHVVVRDHFARAKHRRNHFAVIRFTDESEIHYYPRGVSWRRAKKVLTAKVASARTMINVRVHFRPLVKVVEIDLSLKL